ncbi:protein GVQW1-like [Rhinopithecus roxellana]|uniref:protein GVQW1-like n=1 Tax=Rhinopithecus roxellana TaxID=61622 RepID=UPI0012373137|nr:protein GVQW1-like [Rhinopithecus roxellana]
MAPYLDQTSALPNALFSTCNNGSQGRAAGTDGTDGGWKNPGFLCATQRCSVTSKMKPFPIKGINPDMGFHHVHQTDFGLLGSISPPFSASQSAGVIGESPRARPGRLLFTLRLVSPPSWDLNSSYLQG